LILSNNKEAHALLSEAIQLAHGEYINTLTPGDQFTPERISTLVANIGSCGFQWGFAGCTFINTTGQPVIPDKHSFYKPWEELQHTIYSTDTVGTSLLSEFNPVVCLGNLLFSKTLFESISDNVESSPSLERELCLRMLWLSEPRYVPIPLYQRRIPADRGGKNSSGALTEDALQALGRYHTLALSDTPVNRFAPARSTMGLTYLGNYLTSGLRTALSPEILISLDDEADEIDRQSRSNTSRPLGHGLSILGYFRGDFGLAESVRALAKTCELSGIPASFRDAEFNLGPRQSNRTMDRMLTESLPHKHVLFYMNPDVLTPAWQRLKDRGELDSRYTIGYWYWEIDAYPAKWQHALELVDEVWVATDFVGKVIQRATPKPVHKIPHAIDVKLTRRHTRGEFGLPENVFLYLFSFDFGSFAQRKNPWATIHAFQQAFPKHNAHVGLIIKCSLGYKHPEKLASLQALADDDPRIKIIDKLLSREDVYGLQSVCDAYVSLHRSEGLGLGMAECMALGKPVIATAYSGNLEFMTAENSCLVDYTLIPVKPGEYINYEPGWLWAEADIDHAATYMQRVVEDVAYRTQIGRAAKLHMAKHFNHQVVAQAIQRRLAELAN
jgi:glycosyltransferase involved in cell wall biosynthesis